MPVDAAWTTCPEAVRSWAIVASVAGWSSIMEVTRVLSTPGTHAVRSWGLGGLRLSERVDDAGGISVSERMDPERCRA